MSHQQLTRGELEARLDELETALEDVQATQSTQARENAADRRRITALEDTVEDLNETVETLQGELERVTKERTALARRLYAVEEELDIDTAAVGDGGTPLPLDLLARIGPEAVAESPGPTLQRAYAIAQHRYEWGEVRTNQRYGTHHVLATREHGLKTHLEAAREESLQWVEVYRALEKCAALGGSAVILDEDYGGRGKALVDRRGGRQ